MSRKPITRRSLADLREAEDRGDGGVGKDAPVREAFDKAFWDEATASLPPQGRTSVHLKVDPDVFAFFKSGGRGHVTRMQNVLKAYVNAHRSRG